MTVKVESWSEKYSKLKFKSEEMWLPIQQVVRNNYIVIKYGAVRNLDTLHTISRFWTMGQYNHRSGYAKVQTASDAGDVTHTTENEATVTRGVNISFGSIEEVSRLSLLHLSLLNGLI